MNPFEDDIEGAKQAIKEDGITVTWAKPMPDDEDNPKPWRETEGEPEVHPVDVCLFSPKDLGYGSGSYGQMIDGTEIPTSAEIAMMAGGLDFVPELTDWIVLPSGKADVIRIDRLAPNDIPILFFVWISR